MVSADDVGFYVRELARQLVPMLRVNSPEVQAESTEYGDRLVRECQERLPAVLPLTNLERAFLDLLLDRG